MSLVQKLNVEPSPFFHCGLSRAKLEMLHGTGPSKLAMPLQRMCLTACLPLHSLSCSLAFSMAGKTTFIKYLLGGRDYPGINIGPEPTTDRFVVVEHGLEERRTPGNTLVVQPSKPYQASA